MSTSTTDKAVNTEKVEDVEMTIAEEKVLMKEEALKEKETETQRAADIRVVPEARKRKKKTATYNGDN